MGRVERPIAYLFRGERFWMLSFGGIREGDHLRDAREVSNLHIILTAFPREEKVEVFLRAVRAANPAHEICVLNRHRSKREWAS